MPFLSDKSPAWREFKHIAHQFAAGNSAINKSNNFSTDGEVLYSYGWYVMAIREDRPDGVPHIRMIAWESVTHSQITKRQWKASNQELQRCAKEGSIELSYIIPLKEGAHWDNSDVAQTKWEERHA